MHTTWTIDDRNKQMNMKFHKNEMNLNMVFMTVKWRWNMKFIPILDFVAVLIGEVNGNISNLINWSFSDNTHIFHVTSEECASSHCIRNCRVRILKWFIQIRWSVFQFCFMFVSLNPKWTFLNSTSEYWLNTKGSRQDRKEPPNSRV